MVDAPDRGGEDEEMDADAFVEEVPAGAVPDVSLPPPLPPRRIGPVAIVIGVLVGLVAAGLGLYVSRFLLTDAPPPEAATVDDATEGAEPAPVPIQLDTVVIGAGDETLADDEPVEDEAQPAQP